jgi:hypothetical protein
MDRGMDFLKSQVNNAVMQHRTLLENIQDHEAQAEDHRYRDLCSRFIPRMREHQRMLEEYQASIGAEAGAAKNLIGKALGKARDLADSMRESDFLRIVGDIVTARQSQDTFATFRAAGQQLGITQLQQLGEHGEKDHEEFCREANRVVQQLFVEHARGAEVGADATVRAAEQGQGPRI